jgi:hypothetical protein
MKWFEFLYTLYVFFWLQFSPYSKEKKREKKEEGVVALEIGWYNPP